MNAADRRRVTPALGILAVLLALLLIAAWAGWGRGVHWRDQSAAPPKLPPTTTATPPPRAVPLEQFSAVWQHPLFSPTRSPEVAATGAGEASGDLQLTGVILQPGLAMAILHDKTSGKDYRVIQGQPSRDGSTLVELHPRSAVVESGGSRLQLQLVPGPSSSADDAQTESAADGQAVPMQGGGPGSGMVSRPSGRGTMPGQDAPNPATQSTAARVRALKARIEAERRKAQQQQQGDDGQ